MKTTVIIYGLCNVYYDSFYIEALKNKYSKVFFSTDKFPEFIQNTFAYILIENQNETKVIIDSRDTSEIYQEGLLWSDKYGKINYNTNTSNSDSKKIIPIGPSFGIQTWGFCQTLFLAVRNSIKFRNKITNRKDYIANYWRQYRRLPLSSYHFKNSDNNYVFFMSSIWKKEKKTNLFRSVFIRECLICPEIKFDGGFAPRKDKNNLGFDDILYPNRIALKEYITKTHNSAFVFNTPAVLECHGWKLGEFLALGKAIISTQHINSLPAPLEDNFHILYANDEMDIKVKINTLISDLDLKRQLEINSRKYFDENLHPKIIIEKLVK